MHRLKSFARPAAAALALSFAAVAALAAPALAAPPAAGPATALLSAAAEDEAPDTVWALETANQDGPDGRVSLRHEIEGGSTVADFIAVTNVGERAASFAIYASDGIVSADGNFDLLPAETEAVDGGSWVHLGAVTASTPRDGGGIVLEVAPAATVVVPVEIRIPADATPGDHPAGIVAELVQGAGSSVQLSSRVGVRLHLRVLGDVVARLTPEQVSTTYTPSWNPFAPATVTVRYAVANDGNVRVGAANAVAVEGAFGLARASAAAEQREVLPGQSAQARVDVQVWPLFFGWGEITATPLVVGDDAVAAAMTAVSVPFTVWMLPWSQLALLAVAIAGVLLILAARRRSATRVQARIDAAVAVAVADVAGAAVVAEVAATDGAVRAAPTSDH